MNEEWRNAWIFRRIDEWLAKRIKQKDGWKVNKYIFFLISTLDGYRNDGYVGMMGMCIDCLLIIHFAQLDEWVDGWVDRWMNVASILIYAYMMAGNKSEGMYNIIIIISTYRRLVHDIHSKSFKKKIIFNKKSSVCDMSHFFWSTLWSEARIRNPWFTS